MDLQRFLHRRQYLLGPDYIMGHQNWKRFRLSEGFLLSVHPELGVTQVSDGDNSLVLLGYILDPLNPTFTDRQILTSLLRACSTEERFFEALDGLGGRFVLVSCIHGCWRVIHDAAGFRQVYYHTDLRGRLWVAGEVSLLVENCGLEQDQELRRELFSLPLFFSSQEFWYPSGLTLFRGAARLLPNHYLDMQRGKAVRFWPRGTMRRYPLDTSIEYACSVIEGLMESAVNRFDTALGLTAGLDSRIVLAASKDMRQQIYFFTHTHPKLSSSGADITVPASILARFGLRHNLVPELPVQGDREFLSLINRNVVTARYSKVRNAYTMFKHFQELGREFVVTNGVCGEVTRNFYLVPGVIKVDSRFLSLLAGMQGSEKVEMALEGWLGDIRTRVESQDHLLDLFYWEQRTGSWAAQSYSEYDIAFESFSPFNCRSLIEVSMGVRKELRRPPLYRLHREMIRRMWPQLLDWEINPQPQLFRRIAKELKRTPLHSVVRTVRLLSRGGFLSMVRGGRR